MLNTIPGVRCTWNPQEQDAWLFKAPNIVIHQRFRGVNLDLQRGLIDQGSLLIAEIDDDPEYLQGIPESDFLPLRAVHAVQTTTEVMAETIRRWNPHVAVFPNQIASLPPPREDRSGKGIILFYGAQNRADDWAPIMTALNRVLNAHPEVCVQVIHDRTFFDAIESPGKMFRPFCEYAEYRRVLRSCDIALLPLEPSRHNRHKSDLKFIECAAEGVTMLAGSTVYGPAIVYETSIPFEGAFVAARGLIYESAKEFENLLKELIRYSGQRQQIARNAYAYIRDRRLLSQHYRKRHEWYVDLLKRKPELDRSLFERVPELAPPILESSDQ